MMDIFRSRMFSFGSYITLPFYISTGNIKNSRKILHLSCHTPLSRTAQIQWTKYKCFPSEQTSQTECNTKILFFFTVIETSKLTNSMHQLFTALKFPFSKNNHLALPRVKSSSVGQIKITWF